MNSSGDFQLVLEFDGDSQEHLLNTSSVEDVLAQSITTGYVDGHDVGLGCINIFLFSPEPAKCFEETLTRLATMNYLPTAAGYRKIGSQQFTRVWPVGDLSPFALR